MLKFRSFLSHRLGPACLIIVASWAPSAADDAAHETPRTIPPSVIFDTDMGSDCDDAGALAALHALADAGEVRLLGVIFSSGANPYGAGVCDAIDTYYGRGSLPLGQYAAADVGDSKDRYCKSIATDTDRLGHDIVDNAPDMVSVYKSLLRAEPDESVTILTVGHPHGLVHLMRDFEGMTLVKAKVVRWVAMGGGWNFGKNGVDAYMQELLEKWPRPLYVSLAGADVKTGNRLLPKTPPSNPVREAYRLWNNALSTGRSSWDQLAVLYVARPQLFDVAAHGSHQRVAEERVIWVPSEDNSNHFLVTPNRPNEELAEVIEGLMVRKPKPKP